MKRRVLIPVALGTAVVVGLWLNGPSLRTVDWIGSTTRELTVHVVDARDGRAVPGVAVRLFNARLPGPYDSIGRTGTDGAVVLEHRFDSYGRDTPFGHNSGVHLGEETLTVDAEGYEPATVQLAEYTGPSWPLAGPPLPAVEVRLVKQ
jgi:hypothetical protein